VRFALGNVSLNIFIFFYPILIFTNSGPFHAGKHKVKNFNIYLRPLIDELKNLWQNGAMVRDLSIVDEEKRDYIIRVTLMWTQHDYPGYGVTSTLQTQGMYACPPCRP
jgi:hypothetical protein